MLKHNKLNKNLRSEYHITLVFFLNTTGQFSYTNQRQTFSLTDKM